MYDFRELNSIKFNVLENDGTTIGRESEEGGRAGIVFPGQGVVTVEGGAEGMKATVVAVSKVEAGEKGIEGSVACEIAGPVFDQSTESEEPKREGLR